MSRECNLDSLLHPQLGPELKKLSNLWPMYTNAQNFKTKHSSTSNQCIHFKQYHPKEFAQLPSKSAIVCSTIQGKKTPLSSPSSTTDPAVTLRLSKRIWSEQLLITAAFWFVTKFNVTNPKHQKLTSKLTAMIAGLMLPFSIVNEPKFRDFCRALNLRCFFEWCGTCVVQWGETAKKGRGRAQFPLPRRIAKISYYQFHQHCVAMLIMLSQRKETALNQKMLTCWHVWHLISVS